MSIEVITQAWCDPCADLDIPAKEPATHSPTLTLGAGGAKKLDVCDRHYKEIVEPLGLLLGRARRADESAAPVRRGPGRAKKQAADSGPDEQQPLLTNDGKMICPQCGNALNGQRVTMTAHLVKVHHLTPVKASIAYPPPGPSYACPDCGMLLSDTTPAKLSHARGHARVK